MAKKVKKINYKILVIVAIICGIIAFSSAALSFVHYESVIEAIGTTTTIGDYTGVHELFGTGTESEDAVIIGTITNITTIISTVITTTDWKVNIIANPNVLIAMICVIVGIVCAILSVCMKKKLSSLFKGLGSLAFILAFVFGIMVMDKFYEINNITGDAQKYYSAGIGLIIFDITTCVSGLSLGANLILAK